MSSGRWLRRTFPHPLRRAAHALMIGAHSKPYYTPARSGCRWNDLPDVYGIASTTAWRRLKRWEEDGTWERLWRALLESLDCEQKLRWAEAFLGGSFGPSKRGAKPSE